MMRVALVLLLALTGKTAIAQQLDIPSGVYANDPGHTYVTFSYEHQGLSFPLLRATGVQGELDLEAGNLDDSSVAIAIETNSIRSNLDYFDKELASPKFFNAAAYPHITFIADRLAMSDARRGVLSGIVTIRGISKPVDLDMVINGATMHPFTGTPVIGVSANGSLNRSDFGLDRFIPAVSDRVDVAIEIEFLLGSNEASAAAAAIARQSVEGGD